VQRAERRRAGARGVGGARIGAHLGRVVVDEGVERYTLRCLGEQGLGIGLGTELAAAQCSGGLADRQTRKIHGVPPRARIIEVRGARPHSVE
jgi:hypothetical protein